MADIILLDNRREFVLCGAISNPSAYCLLVWGPETSSLAVFTLGLCYRRQFRPKQYLFIQ